MKIFKYLFAVCSIFLLTSCLVRTIFPLFADNEIYFEQKLIGTWINNDSTEIWEFSKFPSEDTTRNHSKYCLTIIVINKDGSKETSIFEAMTGTIGKHLFLDIIVDNRELYQQSLLNTLQSNYIIFTHTFYKMIFINDSLSLNQMGKEWFNKNQNKFKINTIPHDNGDYITIISRTKELRNFIKKYANNNDAFSKNDNLHKIK